MKFSSFEEQCMLITKGEEVTSKLRMQVWVHKLQLLNYAMPLVSIVSETRILAQSWFASTNQHKFYKFLFQHAVQCACKDTLE
jgi:hypothetical protein